MKQLLLFIIASIFLGACSKTICNVSIYEKEDGTRDWSLIQSYSADHIPNIEVVPLSSHITVIGPKMPSVYKLRVYELLTVIGPKMPGVYKLLKKKLLLFNYTYTDHEGKVWNRKAEAECKSNIESIETTNAGTLDVEAPNKALDCNCYHRIYKKVDNGKWWLDGAKFTSSTPCANELIRIDTFYTYQNSVPFYVKTKQEWVCK